MNMEELENGMTIIKYVYPVISAAFVVIVSLLIYIWRTNTAKTDEILVSVNNNLSELTLIVTEHKIKLEVCEKDITEIKAKI